VFRVIELEEHTQGRWAGSDDPINAAPGDVYAMRVLPSPDAFPRLVDLPMWVRQVDASGDVFLAVSGVDFSAISFVLTDGGFQFEVPRDAPEGFGNIELEFDEITYTCSGPIRCSFVLEPNYRMQRFDTLIMRVSYEL
jgi:hypothetical protein